MFVKQKIKSNKPLRGEMINHLKKLQYQMVAIISPFQGFHTL